MVETALQETMPHGRTPCFNEDLAELPSEAKEVAARAGLLPEYRDLLKGHCRS
jgi:hypothetical protein